MVDIKPASLLLAWYEQNGRALPWRYKGGAHPNPYVVLVSEIMLQQTTVKTVLTYFDRFMQRFPTVQDLAEASLEEVYFYWQGLGYYSRARSLHAAAQTIISQYGGVFPQDAKEVGRLKGLGNYTTASFLALAFNQPATVVDGNVMRIMARMYHLTDPLDDILPQIRSLAEELTDADQAADYASAIMDLGALICTPKKPQCLICPWRNLCQSCGYDDVEQIPQRRQLSKKKMQARVYLIHNNNGEIYIRKRTEKGLLSGLYEFVWHEDHIFPQAKNLNQLVVHIFTHIHLTLQLYEMQTEDPGLDGFFVNESVLGDYAFSTLMKKVWRVYRKP